MRVNLDRLTQLYVTGVSLKVTSSGLQVEASGILRGDHPSMPNGHYEFDRTCSTSPVMEKARELLALVEREAACDAGGESQEQAPHPDQLPLPPPPTMEDAFDTEGSSTSSLDIASTLGIQVPPTQF